MLGSGARFARRLLALAVASGLAGLLHSLAQAQAPAPARLPRTQPTQSISDAAADAGPSAHGAAPTRLAADAGVDASARERNDADAGASGASLAHEAGAAVPSQAAGPASGTSGASPAPSQPANAAAHAQSVPETDEAVAINADATPLPGASATDLKYLLQRVVIVGNRRTRASMIKSFVPLETGATLDVNDPEIEALRYRLLATGWYDRVELRLERGTQPGWVVLVIEVEERATLVFQQLAAGVGWSVRGTRGLSGGDREPGRTPEPYLGLGLAETNLLGTGRTLSLELLASPDQQGISFGFFTPVVRSSRWSFRARASLVKGREYFGGDNDVQVAAPCSQPDLSEEERQKCELRPPVAVVDYWRTGFSLGTSRDVGSFTRLSLDWRSDFVKVPPGGMPLVASELRGRRDDPASRVPIDFSIEPGFSYVSMLTVGLLYDKRDNSFLPSRGTLAGFTGDLASGLLLSDYGFVRVQANYHHWFALPWGHTIRTGVFAGALFGYAPFFYKFFISDLTDLQPARILGLSLDHRPAPNLLQTSIVQMRQEDLAARLDAEYVWPIARGRRRFVKGADAYFLIGLYSLADPKDLRIALPGYDGFSRLPIDLTFDLGARIDTHIGVFQIGLAKLFWLPVQRR